MTKPVAQTVRAIAVRALPGTRRNPMAMVRMRIGPLVVSLAVSRLRKSGLSVRLPMGDDKTPAIEAGLEVWTAIQKAALDAVMRDPVVCEHLFGPEPRRLDRFTEKQLREVGVVLS